MNESTTQILYGQSVTPLTEKRLGISVIVPALNEGPAIGQTVSSLVKTLARIDRSNEIIVVDDGSLDETASIAESSGARVIRQPTNGGYGRSLLKGIDAAQHDVIAIVDADGTYPVERLPDLLALFDKGFDMVVGAREGSNYYSSFSKRVLRLIFRLLAEYTCGRSIPDINSGFRVFYRKPVRMWRASISTGFSFTTTVTLLFMLNNLQVAYTPVSYKKRVGKSKVRLISDGLRSLQIIFTAIAQFNPLKLYLLLIGGNLLGTAAILAGVFTAPVLWGLTGLFAAIAWNAICFIIAIAVMTVAAAKPQPERQDA